MRDTIWTDDLTKALRGLVKENHSASVIAKILNDMYGAGVTRNAVIGKVHRLGVKLLSREPSGGAKRLRYDKPRRVRARVAPRPVSASRPPQRRVKPSENPRLRPDGEMYDTISIGKGDCKWIVEGYGKIAKYCAHQVVPERSWCAGHLARATVYTQQETAQ